ncbi:putative hydrophobic protein (TIGR00271 family) [Thermoflavifilum aggregans]|uniref:Putative hydrophobic protein (TIGR00271 family) n=1 Tax=Thermoflavifilum aggregans TaxID=454188 RepID=A0A2M9CUC6_9BACT|nr:DUF389 domain-containing protein [Thermoflavifilum aggregans]PJJ75445.1 putative hydrophobic protein (TIGR00271 family) [Thermoflavifilum aggregans]
MPRISLFRSLIHHIDLRSEIEMTDDIHQSIERDVVFKGTNLWILGFAIIVASIGLNVNSTAVIIGAMLISPLMGPITGMGYSIAIYDFALFRKALKNLAFAVGASLFASTLYFLITPLSAAHSELLARTSPTIYDVLIAFFGGLAGIIATSSKQKGNVIPGVAIATALMPPLCTAGYGLATAQWKYFAGAFYLFTINATFIAFAATLASQILEFPIRKEIEESRKKVINRLIYLIITLIFIPSLYLGYRLVEKEKFTERANQFVNQVNIVGDSYLLRNEINPSQKTIVLIYGGAMLTDKEKQQIKLRAGDFSLHPASVIIKQGFSFENTQQNINLENERQSLQAQINKLSILLSEKQKIIDSLMQPDTLALQILREINAIYPQIVTCTYGHTYQYIQNDTAYVPRRVDLILLGLETRDISTRDKEKINRWLKNRLHNQHIEVYYQFSVKKQIAENKQRH